MAKNNRGSLESDTRDLARIVQKLETENLRLRAERVNTGRVIAWIRDPRRGRAHTSFTEGPDRQIAYAVEDVLLATIREDACNSLG